MIIRETVALNNRTFIHTYSDMGFEIERDDVIYGDAYDPIEYAEQRIYTEVITETEDLSAEEALNIILGGEV